MKPQLARHPHRLLAALAALTLAQVASIAEAADANPATPARPATPTPAKPAGVWKWSLPGRNGQPEETVLKLATAANGAVTGTLTDRAGTRPVANVTSAAGKIDFTVVRETPSGKVSSDYSLALDGPAPKITIDHPDAAPAAKATGKKRRLEVNATQDKDDKGPPPKG